MKATDAIAMVALLILSTAAGAQVVVLNGKSTIGADAKTGQAVRVVSTNSGGQRVSISSEPAVALVCNEKTPLTTCFAYVKTGSRITFKLRRPTSPRTIPGQGIAPKSSQWAYDCVGTRTSDCTVTMDRTRTVMVDWSR